jgi:hypothetical protein
LLIPFTYIFLYVLGGALRPGYSQIADSVSELLSSGAPNRPLLASIQMAYATLHILYGLGVLSAIEHEGSTLAGIIGAWTIVAIGVATIGTAIYPQDAVGTPETRAGKVHKILVFGVLVPASIISTLLIGIWTNQAAVLNGFDIYSYITAGAITVMGGVGGAAVKTRYAGMSERIAALVTHQWLFALAIVLLINM